MLVLSRSLNDRIVIAESIVIQILELSHGRVRVGIEAPSDIPVWREEVLETREDREYSIRPTRQTPEQTCAVA